MYASIEPDDYLAGVIRLGLRRGVREARVAAKLASHVTLDACRHDGMTELGDAELTEQGVMTLSRHKTPAARKRREWVDANEPGAKVRMGRQRRSQNGRKTTG